MLLRPGGLTRAAIEACLGASSPARRPPFRAPTTRRSRPGMLATHYAPHTPLRLAAARVEPDEALLAFGPTLAAGAENAKSVLNLSPRGDLIEATANLFSHLRALDAVGARAIAAMPIPAEGLGEAINDRLARAAAPR